MQYFASPGRDREERVRLRAATDILNKRLREILREDLGTTYSAYVVARDLEPASPYGYVEIGFGGSPENRDRMVEATIREIERLQKEGPAAEDLDRFKELARRELEVNEKTNGWWLGQLSTAQTMGWDPLGILSSRARIDAVTKEGVQAALVKYWPADRRTVVSLFPEAGTAPDSTRTQGSDSSR
jgi:zinc protease